MSQVCYVATGTCWCLMYCRTAARQHDPQEHRPPRLHPADRFGLVACSSQRGDFQARQLFANSSSTTPPIVISGQFLYNSATGEQFSCRGIGFSLETSASPSPNSKDFFLDSEEVCGEDNQLLHSLLFVFYGNNSR